MRHELEKFASCIRFRLQYLNPQRKTPCAKLITFLIALGAIVFWGVLAYHSTV
jgi:hypothetical protein